MSELIDLLPVTNLDNGDPAYAVDDLRKHATTVINLEGGGLLAVLEKDTHVSFIVTTFAEGPSTQNGQVVGPELHERVFHGSGPSGSLRELRHTYWGEQNNGGYIYYPSAKLITDAFRQLQRWFDCDG